MNDTPSFRDLLAGAAGWWATLTIVFFATFPLWAPVFLWTLRTVLEGLNSFGSGY